MKRGIVKGIVLFLVGAVLLSSHPAQARRVRNTDSCSLKRYDDEILNVTRDIAWREMQNSPVKNAVAYHNSVHINLLLDFIDGVMSKMRESNNGTALLYNIDRIQFLARVAVYFHDTGVYVPTNDKCCSKGHEEKSKAIIRTYSARLGLSEAELEAIQLMMEFTKVKAGEGFRQEALLADEIIQTIEAQAGLSDQAVEYIRGLMPGLDLTDNGDLGLLHDALLLLKSLR